MNVLRKADQRPRVGFSLLRYLRETREVRGYGVEISDANIAGR